MRDRTVLKGPFVDVFDYGARRHDVFVVAGLDLLCVACDGRKVAILPEPHVNRALEALRGCTAGDQAACIGTAQAGPTGMVALKTGMGSCRILDLLSGEQLPRIC